MSDPSDLPEPVVRFLLDQIDSVPHLEALLLLAEAPAREWTAHEMAARIYVQPDAVRAILQRLVGRGLATTTSHGTRYAFDSGWDPAGETMRAVASAYRQHLVQVAGLIHSKGSLAVRDFARAFRWKGDPK